tara:strand:+ start:2050 stop:2184 length:135 start_codon:yes stop_codon:yes gene_type:complete
MSLFVLELPDIYGSPIFNGRFVISGRKPKQLVKTEEKKKKPRAE